MCSVNTLYHLARPERLAAPSRPACRRPTASSDRTLEFECYPELEKKKGPARGPFIFFGAPGEIRTPDRLVRSQVLYPAELRAHCSCWEGEALAGPQTILIRALEVKAFEGEYCGLPSPRIDADMGSWRESSHGWPWRCSSRAVRPHSCSKRTVPSPLFPGRAMNLA